MVLQYQRPGKCINKYHSKICLEKQCTLLLCSENDCKFQIVLFTDGIDSLTESSSFEQFYKHLNKNIQLKKDNYLIQSNSLCEMPRLSYYADVNAENSTNFSIWKYPFPFPNRFDIACLAECNDEDIELREKLNYLDKLAKLNSQHGKLYLTSTLKFDYLMDDFLKTLIGNLFVPFACELSFGRLQSIITLVPTPMPYIGLFFYF
jgi:hypothetical protein